LPELLAASPAGSFGFLHQRAAVWGRPGQAAVSLLTPWPFLRVSTHPAAGLLAARRFGMPERRGGRKNYCAIS